MILTTSEYVVRRDRGRLFNRDDAQTVASWWYSPRQIHMVTFVTTGRVTRGLADEVAHELTGPDLSATDVADLTALMTWARVHRTIHGRPGPAHRPTLRRQS